MPIVLKMKPANKNGNIIMRIITLTVLYKQKYSAGIKAADEPRLNF